ncbi:MAG: hypothetical protein BWZ10_00992 [candidate division BRC1 bacterium ADurb.BinA364]|nr:MAG: hypothetical protein BWZ10_00992 [candidate division BRC1 bacterium ADurb.BinA364]
MFPGSLSSNVQFRMRAASLFHDTVNAVRIETDPPGAAFAGLLRLQYRLWDGDFELGRTERAMRIHRLADDGGIPRWVPLEGFQSLNLEGKTVTAPLNGLAARGAMDGAGGYGTFAVLPGETIEEAFRYIKPSSGLAPAALIAFSSAPFLAPGGGSLYANHKIEIPGYELTDETDPQRIKILIRPPYVWERLSSVGGQSFPDSSNAVFVAETSDASDNPVAFSDPVNLEIEFRSGAGDGFEDLYTLQGQAAALDDMGIVRDAIDGPDVDFEMLEGASWTVSPLPTGGTVLSANIADLTGESGAGAWGAAAGPPQAQARGWAEYE